MIDKKIKIAIIGSGLAGLNASYELTKTKELCDKFQVEIFESNSKLGLDAASITIDKKRIDVPMRSINSGYYPNVIKLYRKLGIKIKRKNYTFSFSSQLNPREPKLLYNGQNGIKGFSINFNDLKFTMIIIISYLSLIFLALYHHIFGNLHDPNHFLSKKSLKEWLKGKEFFIHPIFVHLILSPLFSAVSTSSFIAVDEMPANQMLLYVSSTFLRSHYTIENGVQLIEKSLIKNLDEKNIHLNHSVEKIQRGSNGSNLIVKNSLNNSIISFENYHHIILATPATLSAKLIQSYNNNNEDNNDELEDLIKALESSKYESCEVLNHTDINLLPLKKQNWKDLNIISHSNGQSPAMTTHILFQKNEKNQFLLQTTNPFIYPSKDLILSKTSFIRALTSCQTFNQGLFKYKLISSNRRKMFIEIFYDNHHDHDNIIIEPDWISKIISIFTGKIWTFQIGNLQKNNLNIWTCGSYTQGIPLLEGCITSSKLIVKEIIAKHHHQ